LSKSEQVQSTALIGRALSSAAQHFSLSSHFLYALALNYGWLPLQSAHLLHTHHQRHSRQGM